MAENNFLTYKNKPLVRKGNTIYYGDMSDPFVIMISIVDSHEVHGVSIADKVIVQLMNTDPNVRPRDAIIKKAERKGLWAAMDIGSVWLEVALGRASKSN